MSSFVFRDDATDEYEMIYQSEVANINAHNMFKLSCITEDTLNRSKQLNSVLALYLHVNRILKDGKFVAAHHDYDDYDYDCSDSEHSICGDDDYQEE